MFETFTEAKEFAEEYCEFDKETEPYLLKIIARPRENDQLTHNSIISFNEIIESQDTIERRLRKLWTLAEGYTDDDGNELQFRLYISANPRDAEACLYQFQRENIKLMEELQNGHEGTLKKLPRRGADWESLMESDDMKAGKRFIIDIDSDIDDALYATESALPDYTTTHAKIETPNGYHIITDGFNPNHLNTPEDIDTEIKRDGMIFLAFI